MDYVLNAQPAHLNFSPLGFRTLARDYLDCFSGYKPARISLLPYFLCGRAIELGIKSLHLEISNQDQVKWDFGHDLIAAYNALPAKQQILNSVEYQLLEQTNPLYVEKAFEYIQPGQAARAYSMFPHLDSLFQLADKLVNGAYER